MQKPLATFLVLAALPVALLAFQKELTPLVKVQQLTAVINLKSLAVGMNVYANDFDGVYPNVKDIKTLKVVTLPYMKTKDVWKTANPKSEFRLNGAINGVAVKDITEPAKMVMFYESKPWTDNRRPVVFVDGNAQAVSAHEFAAAAMTFLTALPKAAKQLPDSIGKTWKD